LAPVERGKDVQGLKSWIKTYDLNKVWFVFNIARRGMGKKGITGRLSTTKVLRKIKGG